MGPFFKMDSKAAHGATRPLGFCSTEQPICVPNDLTINRRNRYIQVKCQLQNTLAVKNSKRTTTFLSAVLAALPSSSSFHTASVDSAANIMGGSASAGPLFIAQNDT